MELYLLKFSGCLLALYLVYVLFLEKQNNHHFKRFYLLGAVISSLCIPLITINTYIERTTQIMPTPGELITSKTLSDPIVPSNPTTIGLIDILWILYSIGVIIFFIRFVVNLRKIYKDILSNETIYMNPLTYVLYEHQIIPHSFFKYIFLNKPSYKSGNIPKEVLLHEETHAQQLHSLDIIILELIQIIFWFHPLIYVIKHRVKLNHEFLADEAVLNQGVSTQVYQNILLQFSSSSNHHQLASAINYSSIKKRFTVMKTQTSKTRIWLSTLLLIPVIGLLLFGFTTKKEVIIDPIDVSSSQQINSNPSFLEFIEDMERQGATFYLDDKPITVDKAKSVAQNNKRKQTEILTQKDENDAYLVKLYTVPNTEYARSIELKVLNDNSYVIDGLPATKTTFMDVFNQLHQDISKETRDQLMNIHVISSETLPNEEVWFIYNALQDYGYHRIVTSNQEIIRSKGNTPFAVKNSNTTQQKPPSEKEMAAYKAWIEELNQKTITISKNAKQYPILNENELIKYQNIYSRMTTQQKNAVKEFPFLDIEFDKQNTESLLQPGSNQQQATKEQMDEYNRLAKKFHASPEEERIIKLKDYKRMKYLYGLMSSEQRKAVLPLPKLPPPPQRAMHQGKVNNGIFNKYNKWVKELKNSNGTNRVIPSGEYEYYQSIYNNMTDDQKKRSAGLPPPPPPPIHKGKVSDDLLKRYNYWLKKLKNPDGTYNIISSGESSYYSSIYENMTAEQKKRSVGVPPPPPPPTPMVKEVKEVPPPPPPPLEPLDYVKSMAKANAIFYYEGKRITPKEAIDIVRENQSINFKTKKSDASSPEVYLSKSPIIKEVKDN